MTPKQTLFAENYALNHNGAAAAVRAGYAKRSARQIANELLAKPGVLELIAKYEGEAAQRLAITKARVISELGAAVELARTNGDVMGLISAWREIGKLIGAYAPRRRSIVLSTEPAGLRSQYEDMSDAELFTLADRVVGIQDAGE